MGWGKTVEEYFTGAYGWNSHASVDLILTSVVKELARNPKRKFTFVEMKFFSMWYRQQDQKTQELVKKLVQSGQLEITQGGWTASDEACPNYQDLILNMHIGHKFLWDEFKIKPKVGWMLDSFGHSEANAALFADFGFEAFFFTRASPEVRRQLKKEKKLHSVWTPFSKNTGTERQILTHVYH